MYAFDASALLTSTNNFSSDDYGATVTTIVTGASTVPEPATLVLLSIGMLLVGLRRGAGHREQGR